MHSLLSFLYPRYCLLCEGHQQLLGDLNICVACAADLVANHPSCHCCALPMPHLTNSTNEPICCGECLQSAPPFAFSWSPFVYAQPLEWMIHQLKFNAKLAFAPLLSGLMLREFVRLQRHLTLPEVIMPMPLHDNRLRQRGFNQCELLVRPLAQSMSLSVDVDSCKRVRNTEHQTGKNAQQRRKNIKGAFAVRLSKPYRHVVLFDDVVTTASTVMELSRCLLAEGVERVDVWSLARAEK